MQVDDTRLLQPDETEQDVDLTTEDMLLNMGPQHPATHGVLRVVAKLRGEIVLDAEPFPGYLHRGTEKLAENRFYNQIVPLTDRLDYLSAFNNNLAYVQAVEKLIDLEIPERALYLRTMFGELQRLASHLIWLGTHAMDIGALSIFLYTMREREMILDLFESAAGQRLTLSYAQVGGLRNDIPDGFIDGVRNFLKIFPSKMKEYGDILTKNPIWLERTQDIGVISAKDAIAWSLTGACLRGSGVNYDVRKKTPYAAYDRVDFDVPLGTQGDIYDRYLVRMEEMRQSARIIQQCVDNLPDGPFKADAPAYVQITKRFKAPAGEVYSSIEAPKGELGFAIVSDGTEKPYRMHIRAPSWINLQALPVMCNGGLIADVVGVIGSIDIVLGEVDR
jgi:NADH-quinone oxidoreductase subunit D